MAKSKGRPSWFKMFDSQKALVDAVPDETAGRALKAAFAYFGNKSEPDLDPLSFAVFQSFKQFIDEAFADYEESVESGRTGAHKRWHTGKNEEQETVDDGSSISPDKKRELLIRQFNEMKKA